MIYTVTLNPAIDKTLIIPGFATGCVNRVQDVQTDAGGKGINVSQMLCGLGIESEAMGIAGGQGGRIIVESLKNTGIKTDFVQVSGETRTNIKIVDTEKQITTDVNEMGCTVSEKEIEELLSRLIKKVRQNDIVVLAGSLPKGVKEDTYQHWTQVCKQKGAKVFLDTAGTSRKLAVEAKPYLIKPNRKELEELIEKPLPDLKEICTAAKELTQNGIEKVVVSLGEEGVVFASQEKLLYAPGLKAEVHTTVGAGDAVVAAFVVGEEQSMDDWDTLMLAVASGTAAVTKSGSVPPDAEDILSLVDCVEVRKIIGML